MSCDTTYSFSTLKQQLSKNSISYYLKKSNKSQDNDVLKIIFFYLCFILQTLKGQLTQLFLMFTKVKGLFLQRTSCVTYWPFYINQVCFRRKKNFDYLFMYNKFSDHSLLHYFQKRGL